jgi:hypothetical protein
VRHGSFAVALVAVNVVLDFGVGVQAGAEDGGIVDVIAHYEWRMLVVMRCL